MNKPPSPHLSRWQKLQKSGTDLVDKMVGTAADAAKKAADGLQKFDEAHEITATVGKTGKRIHKVAQKVDDNYAVSERAKTVFKKTADGFEKATTAVKRSANEHGVTKLVVEKIVDPVVQVWKAADSSEVMQKSREFTGDTYGAGRRIVRDVFVPDLPTYDSYELLQSTKEELNYIAACMLQISSEESSRIGSQFSRAVTAKIAGAASTSALLAIVATFGHAGTGAAISGLAGAAATSATMAWVGSLVGGGVAAGAALTGGLALVVGLAAYQVLSSERRDFQAMSPLEQRIVQSCWMLAAIADAYQKRPHEFTPEAAGDFLELALTPLHRDIESNVTILCIPLDIKHSVAMRQHVLRDFRSAVIERLVIYLSWAQSEQGRAWYATNAAADSATNSELYPVGVLEGSDADVLRVMLEGNAEAAIGGVFAAFLTRSALDDSTESRLVLEALRRSTTELNNASDEDLGAYLRSLSPLGLQGMASNVKGIYHELWYVERYNATHEDTIARLHQATNYPGSDVQICDADTGQVVREVQLKAVGTNEAVQEHLRRYPHIDVAVTDEVAVKIDDGRVTTSGFSNDRLHEDSYTRLQGLREHTIEERSGQSALFALGITSTSELVQMLRGERAFPEAVMNTASKVVTAAGATALTAFLFG